MQKKIYAAINKVLLEAPNIAKKRRNQQQNYMFRGIDDFYDTFQPLFAKHGITLDSEISDYKREERTTAKGGVMFYTIIKVRWKFIADDESFVSNDAIGEAMDSGDKSSNKAMSASLKYALTQRFLVSTDEDTDTENHSPEVQAKRPIPPPPVTNPKPQATVPGIPNFANFNSKPMSENDIPF